MLCETCTQHMCFFKVIRLLKPHLKAVHGHKKSTEVKYKTVLIYKPCIQFKYKLLTTFLVGEKVDISLKKYFRN